MGMSIAKSATDALRHFGVRAVELRNVGGREHRGVLDVREYGYLPTMPVEEHQPPIQKRDVVTFVDSGERRVVARAIPSDRGRTLILELEAR